MQNNHRDTKHLKTDAKLKTNKTIKRSKTSTTICANNYKETTLN